MSKRLFAFHGGRFNRSARVVTAGLAALTLLLAFPVNPVRATDSELLTETPVETPADPGIEVPGDHGSDVLLDEPVDASPEAPAEVPAETPADVPPPAEDPDAESTFQPFVYGGVPFDNPGWVASLMQDGSFICTGSLVNAYWVLTAAHCVEDADSTYSINVGSDYWFAGESRGLAEVHLHPHWDGADIASVDLAMVKLDTPVTGVPLPELPNSPAWPEIGQDLWVLGWGQTYTSSPPPDHLQGAEVSVNSDKSGVPGYSLYCNQAWVSGSNYEDFCFGTSSEWACPGDSGGPLVGFASPTTTTGLMRTIYGVTSFGDASGCSETFWDPVAQSVGPHVNWIRGFYAWASAGDEMFFYRTDGLYAYYDVKSGGALGSKLSGGVTYTKNWSQITAVDLDGDGKDEMFFYRADGFFAYYDVKPNGSLGSKLLSGNTYTKNWSEITAVDLDGDGKDEMFFYRADGLYAYYDVTSTGALASKLSGATTYTKNWSEITAVDLDGDGKDEMFFYRADGLYAYYDVTSTGALASKLSGASTYTKNWSSITSVDLDADGKDEMFFYRVDGLYAYYDVKSGGALGTKLSGSNTYTKNWSSITSVNLGG